MSQRRLILLGPQDRYQSLQQAIHRIAERPRIALITAGWEEDESNDGEIRSSLPGCLVENLQLFHRSEQLFASDEQFIQRLQKRQDDLRELRDIYRIRLEAALGATKKLLALPDGQIDFEPEREMSIDSLRKLDQQYFFRTSQIVDQYEDELKTAERPIVVHHRDQLARALENLDVLVISGGHAAIILNRLKIFGVLEMRPDLPIIAWSAAAMALSEQIVFFHDSPPQGPGIPELLRAGMGYYSGILPFPDAKKRLKLNDFERVRLLARRFDRYSCVVLDETTILDRVDGQWTADGQPLMLDSTGEVKPFQP